MEVGGSSDTYKKRHVHKMFPLREGGGGGARGGGGEGEGGGVTPRNPFRRIRPGSYFNLSHLEIILKKKVILVHCLLVA